MNSFFDDLTNKPNGDQIKNKPFIIATFGIVIFSILILFAYVFKDTGQNSNEVLSSIVDSTPTPLISNIDSDFSNSGVSQISIDCKLIFLDEIKYETGENFFLFSDDDNVCVFYNEKGDSNFVIRFVTFEKPDWVEYYISQFTNQNIDLIQQYSSNNSQYIFGFIPNKVFSIAVGNISNSNYYYEITSNFYIQSNFFINDDNSYKTQANAILKLYQEIINQVDFFFLYNQEG